VTDEAVHPQRGADVAVEVELRGVHHRLQRRRPTTGATKFTLEAQDPATGVWGPEPQSKDPHRNSVEALLGLDYTAFRYAVVVQGADALAADGFPQQMAVLETLLRLDELSPGQQEAARRTTARDRALAVARTELTGLGNQLAEVRQTMELLERTIAGDAAALAREEAELTARRDRALEAQRLLPKARDVATAHGDQLAKHRQDATVASTAMTPLLKEQEQVEKRQRSLVCPTCNRPYGTKADAEKAQAKATKRLEEITTELRTLGQRKDTADRAAQQLNLKLYAVQDEVRKLEREAHTLPDIEAQLAALARRDKERQQQREFLETRLAELAAQQEEKVQAVETLTTTHRRSAVWVAGFGRDGLQADLFALGMPELNRAAQRYSDALAGSHLRVSFNPQRESRRDNLILVEGATAPTYQGCSRGEKERINLIVAFSLRALARWRLGEPINLSVFDEVFDHVDPGGLQAIARLLQAELAATGGTIFVITHNPTLKALFPGAKLLRVVREGGEATVYYG
jgi:DNA repair exonuclease SbcCD ATPase subunit